MEEGAPGSDTAVKGETLAASIGGKTPAASIGGKTLAASIAGIREPSFRQLRKMLKEKGKPRSGDGSSVGGSKGVGDAQCLEEDAPSHSMGGLRPNSKRKKVAGADCARYERAQKEDTVSVVASPAKKRMTRASADLNMDWSSGGNGSSKLHSDGNNCGSEDAGDGMDDHRLLEAPASAKGKFTVLPTDGAGTKKDKRWRGSKTDGCGSPGRMPARKPHAPRIVVANTPSTPCRYGYLLKMLTWLLPYKSQGKAYECTLNRVNKLMKWSRCNLCLFFEWLQKDREMVCWIFNALNKTCVKFLVNPAITFKMSELKIKRAICAFSLNFGTDETWVGVKETLEMMFCPSQHEFSSDTVPDHLYVFTRINDLVYFRNMKIEKLPNTASGKSLVLKEVGPYFCLKLVVFRGENAAAHPVSDVPESQIQTELSMCPIEYLSLSPELGSRASVHSLNLNGEKHLILLESGQDLSVFDGYNINLQELLGDQPFVKAKHIVGSKTDEQGLFVRNIGKAIIRSIFAYFIELFASKKCIKMMKLKHSHILLKGISVKLHGVELVDYDESLAEQNVLRAIELVRSCFPPNYVPLDLMSMLLLLTENPVQNLQAAKDDSSLLFAKERRELLVYLHTQYMSNVKPKLMQERGFEDHGFFKNCPYLKTWMDTMERNTYLTVVANYNALLGTLKMQRNDREKKEKEKEQEEQEEDKANNKKRRKRKRKEESLEKRKNLGKRRKENLENESAVARTEDGNSHEMGELQLSVMRNCDVHIPENVVKDGIVPFRLSWSDYIRTFYYPRYLAFIQTRMMKFMKLLKDASNENVVDNDEEETCRENEEENIIKAITS